MKRLIVLAAAMLIGVAHVTSASTIAFTAPTAVSGAFDVVVQARDLFVGRDATTDLLIAYGFNVTVSDSAILQFVGATSGALFDPATTEPGTNVFAAAFGQNGFGIEPGIAEPVTLAVLHFTALGPGPASILVTSDVSNPFQGLQYFNAPFQESIVGTVSVTTLPEPATILLMSVGLLWTTFLMRRTK